MGVQRKKGWKGGMGGPGFYDCGGARFFSVGPWSTEVSHRFLIVTGIDASNAFL